MQTLKSAQLAMKLFLEKKGKTDSVAGLALQHLTIQVCADMGNLNVNVQCVVTLQPIHRLCIVLTSVQVTQNDFALPKRSELEGMKLRRGTGLVFELKHQVTQTERL